MIASVGLSPFVGLAAPATTWRRGLLDAYRAQLVAVRSPMLLVSSWSGPSQRVRRSADTVVHDVPFRGEWQDGDDLSAFAGAGSAYVMTDYDQSGLGHHWTQTGAAEQPRVINAGVPELFGGRPAERFGLAPGMGYAGTGFALAQPFTIILTWMPTSNPAVEHTLLSPNGPGIIYGPSVGNQLRVSFGNVTFPATWAVNTPMAFGYVVNGAASRAVVNGAAGGPFNAGSASLPDALWLGVSGSQPARVLNGYLPDMIILSGAVPNADIIKIQRELGAPRGIVIP